MGTRRKVLFTVAAIALPATSVLVFGTPALFAGATTPAFPVTCKVDADFTFTPPLTKTGTHTTNRAATTTVAITNGKLTGCLSGASAGAPTKGTFAATIDLPATSIGRIAGVKTYATGYCPAFTQTSTLKAVRKLAFAVLWTKGEAGESVFTTKRVISATNSEIPPEYGWVLSAKEGLGSYAEKSLNQFDLYFDGTDSAAMQTGCSASQTVSSATLDSTNSVGTL